MIYEEILFPFILNRQIEMQILNTIFKGKVSQIPKASIIMMVVILYLYFDNPGFNLIFIELWMI